MFLQERIIGIITYMLVMLIMVFLIYNSKTKKKVKRYLVIYWIILSIMAFFYIPAKSADLNRLFETMHSYTNINFIDLINIMTKSNIPTQHLYFWIIGNIKIDGLLPSITSMIFFGCTFSIIYRMSIKYEIENKNIAIALLFFMQFGKFLEVISGIRSLMAFSIIAWCIYTEVIEDRKTYKNIFLYVFAALMHNAALILVLIRLLFLPLQKERKKIKRIINIFAFFILDILLFRFFYNNIEVAVSKANFYMENTVYSYVWEYIICWIYVLYSTSIILINNKMLNKSTNVKNLKNFLLFINIIVIILSNEYSIFDRFSTFSSILFIPVLEYVIQQKAKDEKSKKVFTYIFWMISVTIIILVGTRGNLSGYKFLLYK